MPVSYQHFTTASPPKAGNQWLRAAVESCGHFRDNTRLGMHTPGRHGDRSTMTITRSPDTWLASYFANNLVAQTDRWCPELMSLNEVWRGLKDPSFDEFIEAYIDTMPGHVSGAVFPAYQSDYTVRLEHCEDDLILALTDMGVSCDPDAIRGVGHIARTPRKPLWDEGLRAKFMEHECQFHTHA